MSHREIPIPGGSTRFDDRPEVAVSGGGNDHVTVRLTYHSDYVEPNQPVRFGQITFTGVLEYRFVDDMVEYEEFDRHKQDVAFGLIEIVDSQYVERMLAHSSKAAGPPGRRLAEHVADHEIHHYRIVFDEWGLLDVIAFDLEVGEIVHPA